MRCRRQAYPAPTVYGDPGSVYVAPPNAYRQRSPAYVAHEGGYVVAPPYAIDLPPRPPANIPYDYGTRCDAYGRCGYYR